MIDIWANFIQVINILSNLINAPEPTISLKLYFSEDLQGGSYLNKTLIENALISFLTKS